MAMAVPGRAASLPFLPRRPVALATRLLLMELLGRVRDELLRVPREPFVAADIAPALLSIFLGDGCVGPCAAASV